MRRFLFNSSAIGKALRLATVHLIPFTIGENEIVVSLEDADRLSRILADNKVTFKTRNGVNVGV